ncbi:MAG TPA: GAF domain-containing sensor histidine kinase [Vicinamibacterales bacterium]
MSAIDLNRLGVFRTPPGEGAATRAGKDTGSSQVSPPETGADQELTSSLAWLIRLRWIAGFGVVLATLVGARIAGLPLAERPLVLIGLGIIAYNAVFHLIPARLPGRPLESLVARQWFARVQIGVDWVATAALIHFTGGIESPAIIFYLFHITIASLLLPHDRGFFYVALAPALVGAVAVGEYLGLLRHVPFVGGGGYASPTYIATVLSFFTGSAYAMAYFSISISRRLRRREREIAGLYESVRLSTSTLEVPLVLARLTEAVVKALHCRAASIRLLDRTGRLDTIATHGLSDAYEGKAPMDLGKALVDREVLSGKIVLVADVATDARVYHPEEVQAEGIKTMLCAPLLGKSGAIGVLRAYGGEDHEFTSDDGVFLGAVGAHGAVAIENAQAYDVLKTLDREKSRFVRIVTHELRSPLQVTQNLMAVLRGGYTGPLNERQVDLLERARHRVAFLETLVDDLLDLAAGRTDVREEKLDHGLVRLADALRRVSARFEAACRAKGLFLRVACPDESLSVWSDEAAIDRLADNLVGNAVKYTRVGGVRVELTREEETARIVVADTGIGIPTAEQPRLFQEFFRARNAKEVEEHGTGLGLAIVRDLVTRCGGRVAIESAENQGTTVTVLLPLARDNGPDS